MNNHGVARRQRHQPRAAAVVFYSSQKCERHSYRQELARPHPLGELVVSRGVGCQIVSRGRNSLFKQRRDLALFLSMFQVGANSRPSLLSYLLPETTNSSLAGCFEHSRFKRLACSRAGPGHKLKCRVVALACVEGSGQEHLALSTRCVNATGKHERMAKYY